MRGSQKARRLLARLREVGIEPTVAPGPDGKPGLSLGSCETPEQQEMAVEACMFAIAYPGCMRVAVRIVAGELP